MVQSQINRHGSALMHKTIRRLSKGLCVSLLIIAVLLCLTWLAFKGGLNPDVVVRANESIMGFGHALFVFRLFLIAVLWFRWDAIGKALYPKSLPQFELRRKALRRLRSSVVIGFLLIELLIAQDLFGTFIRWVF